MDTKHLLTFITLAKEKNYLSTSLKLNYAPSTLASHVNALETEMKTKLVERSGKQMLLTSNGEIFLEYAQQFLQMHEEIHQRFSSHLVIQGSLRVGTAASIGQYSLTEAFNKYVHEFPNVEFFLKVTNCATFPDLLKDNIIDIGYGYEFENAPLMEPSSPFEVVKLFQEPLHFVVHPNHFLAKKKDVVPSDFKGQKFALTYEDCCYAQALNNMLDTNNVTLKTQTYLGSIDMIKNYILQNHGIGLLPSCSIKQEIESLQLRCIDWAGKEFSVWAHMVYLKNRWVSPAMKELMNLSLQYVKNKK